MYYTYITYSLLVYTNYRYIVNSTVLGKRVFYNTYNNQYNIMVIMGYNERNDA